MRSVVTTLDIWDKRIRFTPRLNEFGYNAPYVRTIGDILDGLCFYYHERRHRYNECSGHSGHSGHSDHSDHSDRPVWMEIRDCWDLGGWRR